MIFDTMSHLAGTAPTLIFFAFAFGLAIVIGARLAPVWSYVYWVALPVAALQWGKLWAARDAMDEQTMVTIVIVFAPPLLVAMAFGSAIGGALRKRRLAVV